MYNILISTDDGIDSIGLTELVRSVSAYAKVYVAAPARQQSAKAMSISAFRDRMRAYEVPLEGAELAFIVDGTPSDCVKFGLQMCRERGVEIDFVLGGINLGANVGMDTHYSGTVACAFEGALQGYHAAALSVAGHLATHFEYICSLVPMLIRLSEGLSTDTVLNVNAPDLPPDEIRGIQVRRGGGRCFDIRYVPDNEPRMYYCEGYLLDRPDSAEDTDVAALYNGYAVITPQTLSRTDFAALEQLSKAVIATDSHS
ncbi:MAG: hypothetical protein IJH91_05185 [Mogibacterium sp.]|nr:hypothetical protein [Mogibacterium sp.]